MPKYNVVGKIMCDGNKRILGYILKEESDVYTLYGISGNNYIMRIVDYMTMAHTLMIQAKYPNARDSNCLTPFKIDDKGNIKFANESKMKVVKASDFKSERIENLPSKLANKFKKKVLTWQSVPGKSCKYETVFKTIKGMEVKLDIIKMPNNHYSVCIAPWDLDDLYKLTPTVLTLHGIGLVEDLLARVYAEA